MEITEFICNAEVMSKWQVTIPKAIRATLSIGINYRVTFILDDTEVKFVNSAVYSLMKLQKQMQRKVNETNPFT